MISLPLMQYVLKAAIRDKLVISMFVMMILTVSMSVFMASSAMFEQEQFLAVYASGSLRILSVLGLVLFTVFFVRRSFEARDVEFLLSRPISRVKFILSYAAALSCLGLFMGVATTIAMFIIAGEQATNAYFLWGFSLIIENIIMVNMALFFAMVLSSPATATLGVLAFYSLTRMMGQILGILESGMGHSVMDGVQMAMNMVSTLTPRLDLVGQTSWLVYGISSADVNFMFFIIQGAIFIVLTLLAALLDLTLRQF